MKQKTLCSCTTQIKDFSRCVAPKIWLVWFNLISKVVNFILTYDDVINDETKKINLNRDKENKRERERVHNISFYNSIRNFPF